MDANEFKSLFIPYHAKLYRTAYSILRNVQDAEDIVQDAYLKLWNRRDELDAAVCREAYCVTLVKNLCMDFIRSSHSNYMKNGLAWQTMILVKDWKRKKKMSG